VRLVIPLILTLLRARIAAPLLRAQREAHSREMAKYSERLTELSAEVRAAEARAQLLDKLLDNCHVALDAAPVPPKLGPAVPEARRMAILGIVEQRIAPWTARQIGIESGNLGWEVLHPLSASSVERLVTNLAREGWLADDGKKPRRYSLTNKGRDALRESA
jgi:hypothetical protein